MSASYDFQMPNELPALEGLIQNVIARLEEHGAAPGAVYAANLALEELITNILKYGYDDQDPHIIRVLLVIEGDRFRIQILDDGHEFNPFAQAEPDTSLPIHLRPIGGLGIHFCRNMLDECLYERLDGENIVTVSKALQTAE